MDLTAAKEAIEVASLKAEIRRLLAHYRMPAEWESHLATYLVWPHNHETWPGKLEAVADAFARIVAALADRERVRILIRDLEHGPVIMEMLRRVPPADGMTVRSGSIELVPLATNDSWIRDYGPIFLNRWDAGNPRQLAVGWRFNSWGGKYGPFELDDSAAPRLAERYGFELLTPHVVLEGGSIDVNGAGAVLTTEACLLNRNRNPAMSRGEIEENLRVAFGAQQILWLGGGIAGDDTDGHVDNLARFTAAGTIVAASELDPADDNYKPLEDNLRRLRAMRDLSGRPWRIETLPMPAPLYCDGARLPASYLNFYIANGLVLMPTFGCAADEAACSTLARLFPGRRVITVPSEALIIGLGGIHCLTQQHPNVEKGAGGEK